MTVDHEDDLQRLKEIGRIVALTLQEMKNQLRPGITTAELDSIGEGSLHRYGARSAPRLVYNFPGSTCISLNSEAAHGIPGNRVIQPGDLVNIDVSAELDGYFADTAASIPVPPVSPLKKKLCDCASQALGRALNRARAGAQLNEIGRTVENQARHFGFTVLREVGGHGVGSNIHEEPSHILNFPNPMEKRHLSEGLVITIEPFISNGGRHVIQAEDGWTLLTADGSLSAQFEHTLVVTRGKPILITAL
jgi:methionyl aminopeptidase